MNELTGRYLTADKKAFIEWELKKEQKGLEFTASGDFDGDSCQIIDKIAEAYPKDKMVQRIFKVWKEWHLNGLHAGCQHQRKLGWGNGKDIAFIVKEATKAQISGLTEDILRSIQPKRVKWIAESRDAFGTNKTFRMQIWKKIEPKRNLTAHDNDLLSVVFLRPKGVVVTGHPNLTQEVHSLLVAMAEKQFPVKIENRIYEDSIGAPCPKCGYCYGTEWKFEEIPATVLKEIRSWKSNTDGNLADNVTEDFCAKWKIKMVIKEAKKNECPPFCDKGDHIHGRKYDVILMMGNKTLILPFWNSYNDAQAGVDPEASSILGCYASDIRCPDTFEDFCGEFGYDEDSRKAFTTWQNCSKFSKELNRFFDNEEMVADLQRIQP